MKNPKKHLREAYAALVEKTRQLSEARVRLLRADEALAWARGHYIRKHLAGESKLGSNEQAREANLAMLTATQREAVLEAKVDVQILLADKDIAKVRVEHLLLLLGLEAQTVGPDEDEEP